MSYRRRDKAIASKILSGCLSGYAPGDQRPAVPAVTQSITEREREVLTRIALGNSNKLTGSAPLSTSNAPMSNRAPTRPQSLESLRPLASAV